MSSTLPTKESPVALSVQHIFDQSLDVTAQKLESLQESQTALSTQLDLLMNKLQQFDDQTEPVELSNTVTKIAQSRKRLAAVNATLKTVHERLTRVKERLS